MVATNQNRTNQTSNQSKQRCGLVPTYLPTWEEWCWLKRGGWNKKGVSQVALESVLLEIKILKLSDCGQRDDDDDEDEDEDLNF